MLPQMVNIFVSFSSKQEAATIIALLEESDLLNDIEKQFIIKYKLLLDTVTDVPNKKLLAELYPTLGFDNAREYSSDILISNIELLLKERKRSAIASGLLKVVSKVQIEGITSAIKEEIDNLTALEVSNKVELVDITNIIEEKYDEGKAIGGILTGIGPIDESTGGIYPGTLTTIMGYTGAYKTLSAVNITYSAINAGKNVCYVSLEVPKEHLLYDILSRHSNNTKFSRAVGHFDMKKHKLSENDKNLVFKTILEDYKEIKGKALFLDESDIKSYTKLGLEQLFREADKMLVDLTGHGVDLLIIDHAQLLKFNESGFNLKDPYQVVNYYTSFLRQQSISFLGTGRQVATIVLSQTSREGYKSAVKRQGQYDLTALAEANELERASQNVIGLYLDESLKNSKQVKVQVLKARDGATMPEPVTVFADPEFYILGADVANPIDIGSFNVDDLFNAEPASFNNIGDFLND